MIPGAFGVIQPYKALYTRTQEGYEMDPDEDYDDFDPYEDEYSVD